MLADTHHSDTMAAACQIATSRASVGDRFHPPAQSCTDENHSLHSEPGLSLTMSSRLGISRGAEGLAVTMRRRWRMSKASPGCSRALQHQPPDGETSLAAGSPASNHPTQGTRKPGQLA